MLPRYVEELDKLERVSKLCQDIKDLEFNFPQRILYEIDDLIKEFSNSCVVCRKINSHSENLDGDCKCINEDSDVKIGSKRTIREKCAEDFRIKRRRCQNRRPNRQKRGSRDSHMEVEMGKTDALKTSSTQINGSDRPKNIENVEINKSDVLKSSLTQINGSDRPKNIENVEIKESDVLKSNLNQKNGVPSAEKEPNKYRFKSTFVPSDPNPAKTILLENRRISPFFQPQKRKIDDEPTKSKSAKRKRHETQNGSPGPRKTGSKRQRTERFNAMLSHFKETFYADCKPKMASLNQLMDTVVETLKKCKLNYSWVKRGLRIDWLCVSSGDSRMKSCENLVAKLGNPYTPVREKLWHDKAPPECLREIRRYLLYTPIDEATVDDLTKFVPKLVKCKRKMALCYNQTADSSEQLDLVARCGVCVRWKCYSIGAKFVCDLILDRIIVSEGKGEDEMGSWRACVQVFVAGLDGLIASGCERMNRISSLVPSLGKGIEQFVLFEFAGASTQTTLRYSAYLNGVALNCDRTTGSYTISLGTIRIGSTSRKDGENEAQRAALKHLRANCFAVQVKSRMIYSWGVKTSEIESSNFMDWDLEFEPQIFAVSKPVRSEFEKYISAFANTYYVMKLSFSPNFAEDEKQEIRSIARSLGLQVTTETHDAGPLLVVSGKVHPQSLVQSLLLTGQTADEYNLIPPSNWKGITA